MKTFDEKVNELQQLLRDANAIGRATNLLNVKLHANRWRTGRVCFEIFGRGKVSETGSTVRELAAALGCSAPRLYGPLQVYRVLGSWFERQIDPVPFTIAKRTVQHTRDVADAERLMEVWRKRGEPDEAEWEKFLDSAAKLSAAQNMPLPDDPDEAEKQLRREARKKFKRFRRRLKAAAEARFFANSYLTPDEAKELLGYLGPLMGKRSNLLKIAKRKQDQGDSGSGTAETLTELGHTAPVVELSGADDD